MDAPQKVEGFLKNLKELSKIEGIEQKIRIKPRDQVIKHVKLEDLDEDFDIDFDLKEEDTKAEVKQ